MSYEVTASRRRPQRFEELIGQDFVSATLQKSIAAGKIAHAYLFSGPRGCGKTTSARVLAKALNCEKGPAPTPCGECVHCQEITKGVSLDVIEIDGASNTSVNDVRQIKDEVLFPPNSSRYKIYIIDEVHMLSTNAFNALLKTIEEPPPYVVFIFATTELHKVPATIKSRCQQFNFRLVPVELLKDALAAAAREIGIQADDEALYWIARQGNGSVRDSYTLFDQVAAFSDGHITFDKIKDKLGLTGFDKINALAEFCAGKNPRDALSLLDEILETGVSTEQFIVDCADYFRNLLFIQSGITKESLLGQSPARFSQKVLSAWGSDKIERALEIMLQLFRDIRYSLDARCETELAVSRLCWLSDYVSPEEMKKAFEAARAIIGAGGRLPEPQTSSQQNPAPRVSVGAANGTGTEGGSDAGGAGETPGGFTQPAANIHPAADTHPAPNAQPVTAGIHPAGYETARASAPPTEAGASVPDTTESGFEATADAPEPASAPRAGKITDIRELPAALSEFFADTKTMLAVIFPKTSNWVKRDGEIVFEVETPFQFNQMEAEKAAIRDALRELLGETLSVSVKIRESSPGADGGGEPAIPEQVETVRDLFRGTVLPT